MITILILKILKEFVKFKWQLSNFVAFIRLKLFLKIDLQYWMDHPFERGNSVIQGGFLKYDILNHENHTFRESEFLKQNV